MPGRSNCSPGPTRSSATAARRPRPTPRPSRPSCSSRSAGSRWSWSGSKKKSERSPERLRPLVESDHPELSVRRQCALLELSAARAGHRIYPYLLRNVSIERPDQVWSTDITYVPLPSGFMYLAAIIDWFSRYVIAWRLSNTLDGSFCLEMLEEALGRGRPEVFNTDQGVQFTAQAWTGRLESAGVAVSMDGRGRCLDNVFVERLWRTVKYEDIYLWRYEAVSELQQGLGRYFPYYNEERLHQALGYRTPAQVYREGRK